MTGSGVTNAGTRAAPSPLWALETLARDVDAPDANTAMVARCRALLEKHGQIHGPVALKPLLQDLGAQQDRRPMETLGRLSLRSEGWRISVRQDTPWRRARFTIAHEVGHILLCEMLADHPQALRALRDASHWPVVERLCNVAAAEILMPADDFARAARTVSLTPDGLRALYDRYLVSWEPLLLRVGEVFGGSLVPFSRHQRHYAERRTLRVMRAPHDPAVWMPEGLTSRYLRPDIVGTADADGFAVTDSMLIDLRTPRVRRPAGIAVSLRAARASRNAEPTLLDGFSAPDESQTPFDVALLLNPDPDANWRALSSAPARRGSGRPVPFLQT